MGYPDKPSSPKMATRSDLRLQPVPRSNEAVGQTTSRLKSPIIQNITLPRRTTARVALTPREGDWLFARLRMEHNVPQWRTDAVALIRRLEVMQHVVTLQELERAPLHG